MKPGMFGIFVGCVSLIAVSTGGARAGDCYFSAECDGQQVCVNAVCEDSGGALPACDVADESACSWDETCDEGYCKPAGVVCENPAGSCEVTSSSSECGCADGMGMGSSSGGAPGGGPPEKSGEELYGECVDMLESTCGTEAPKIEDYCTAQQQTWCEESIPKIEQMAGECGLDLDGDETVSSDSGVTTDAEPDDGGSGEEPPRPTPPPEELPLSELIGCCKMLEQDGSDEFVDCIDDLAADDCDGLEACLDLGVVVGGDGESYDEATADKDGTGSNRDDGEAADESAQSEDDGGCAMVPRKSAGLSVFGFVFHLMF